MGNSTPRTRPASDPVSVPGTTPGPDVVAAGAVITRGGPEGREVLLVHRPSYDDWAFPKGKQDPGEHVAATAVREVFEETGVEIRLGRPLSPQHYRVKGDRAKVVHYWAGHVIGDDDVASYVANAEVDNLGWFPVVSAAERLTYSDDVALLEEFRQHPRTSSALILVRHAKALKRDDWDRPDPQRPLAVRGLAQAQALTPLLQAYGVARVVSSSSIRCLQTVEPYALAQTLPVVPMECLSEEAYDVAAARLLLQQLMASAGTSVVCSHAPVLPELLALLGLQQGPLGLAEAVVCHHRKGRVVATERHTPVLG